MRIVLNAAQMREVDSYMIHTMNIPGIVLMENAAMGVANLVMEQVDPGVVYVFCGVGNNGGDGLAAARILLAHGYDVYVVVAGELDRLTADAAANLAMFRVLQERTRCIGEIEAFLTWDIPPADIVIDALFGTGLTRPPEGIFREIIRLINETDAPVVSVDIPSGICADTGAVLGTAVRADFTATFQYPKAGHYLFPGREYAGVVEVVKVGVDDGCDVPGKAGICVYESGDEDITIGRRSRNTNKGDYGRLLLIAGSRGMAGAAVLSARAATRAGAGLVTVGAPDAVVDVIQQTVPEATCRALPDQEGSLTRHSVFDIARIVKGKTAIAIGPGLGAGEGIRDIVLSVLRDYDVVKVLDADAINAIAGHPEVLKEKAGDVILTPHPKEFSRLIDVDMARILENPVRYAVEFAKEYDVTLVLKGAATVVADRDGSASLVCAGSPGMAKGGSGDVLTGVIAGLAAQGKSAASAALIGVYIAGMAGMAAAEQMGEYSMTPMDAVNEIGFAMNEITVDYIEADRVLKECPEAAGIWAEEDGVVSCRPEETVAVPLEPKTPEQALGEIEEREKTQEIKKEILNELIEKDKNGDSPTRRRIG